MIYARVYIYEEKTVSVTIPISFLYFTQRTSRTLRTVRESWLCAMQCNGMRITLPVWPFRLAVTPTTVTDTATRRPSHHATATVRPTVVIAAATPAPPRHHRRFHAPPHHHRRYHTATSSSSLLPHLTAARHHFPPSNPPVTTLAQRYETTRPVRPAPPLCPLSATPLSPSSRFTPSPPSSTSLATGGLGDASVTPVGRRPKTRRTVDGGTSGGVLGIRRLDVIDPNRSRGPPPFAPRPTQPPTPTLLAYVRACTCVTAFFTARSVVSVSLTTRPPSPPLYGLCPSPNRTEPNQTDNEDYDDKWPPTVFLRRRVLLLFPTWFLLRLVPGIFHPHATRVDASPVYFVFFFFL